MGLCHAAPGIPAPGNPPAFARAAAAGNAVARPDGVASGDTPKSEGAMPEAKTLPDLCLDWRERVDWVRKLIRNSPELRKLGTPIGALRAYAPAEAAKIKAAIADKRRAAGAAR